MKLEDIVDGVYLIEDILTGCNISFRTVILNPTSNGHSYHIADPLVQFPVEAVGVAVDIKNGKIFSYVY